MIAFYFIFNLNFIFSLTLLIFFCSSKYVSIFNSLLPKFRDEVVSAVPQGHLKLMNVVNRNGEEIIEKMTSRVNDLRINAIENFNYSNSYRVR